MTRLVGQDGVGFVTPTSTNDSGAGGNALCFGSGYLATAGTADTAWINIGAGANSASTIKVCAYDAGGNLAAVSSPITISLGLVSAAISVTLTAQVYTLVATPDSGSFYAIYDSGTSNFLDHQFTAAHFSYTSPPATLPASDLGTGHEFIIYLTGSLPGGAQGSRGQVSPGVSSPC